jgi:hypothetical protein
VKNNRHTPYHFSINSCAQALYINKQSCTSARPAEYSQLAHNERDPVTRKPVARIKISPPQHWAPRRIEARVMICTLVLLIQRVAERRCERPWSRILHELQELQISYFSTFRHRFYRRNQLSHMVCKKLK